jgi:hypothetical protein
MPSVIEFLSHTSKPLPGECSRCEFCGQRPDSIAFDLDECRDPCPIRRVVHAGANPAHDRMVHAVCRDQQINKTSIGGSRAGALLRTRVSQVPGS